MFVEFTGCTSASEIRRADSGGGCAGRVGGRKFQLPTTPSPGNQGARRTRRIRDTVDQRALILGEISDDAAVSY